MNKILLLLSCSYLFSFQVVLSQENKNLGSKLSVVSPNLSEYVELYKYPREIKAKIIYTNLSEVKNSTPEELLSSHISATSNEWVDYNTDLKNRRPFYPGTKHFEKTKELNRNKTFFLLDYKVDYKENGVEYCLVKYYLKTEFSDKKFPFVKIMKKNNKRWYFSLTFFSSKFSILLKRNDFKTVLGVLKKEKKILEKLDIYIVEDSKQKRSLDELLTLYQTKNRIKI